ncbi:MAG: hypothetical protein IIT60_00405, partial [Muribaculaceae bacterium]|nr:hypothetical protein [Muribaculaceae bacterium]
IFENSDANGIDSMSQFRDYANSLSTLANEVNDGLSEIKDMERIVTTNNLANEPEDKKNQMKNDILLIKNSVQERLNRLAELEEQLTRKEAIEKFNESERKELLDKIEVLKTQLAQQQEMINTLTAKLEAANITIKNLNEKVDSLKTENTVMSNESKKAKEEAAKAKEEMERLNNELNECFYAVGSKKELKDHKIIESGFLRKTKVMQNSNIMYSYFTKADKRTLNQIALHSKKAQVMSKHPSGSYSIEEVGGQKVLNILNPNKFWELSNYLVVKID